MRQFEFEYKNEQKLRQDLKKLIMWCKANIISDVVFHIFTEKLDTARISNMCRVISDEFPEAKYMGCTTNGNVHNAGFTRKDMIICTVFEYVSTKVEIQQYDLNSDTEADVTNTVVEYIKNNPWIKAVEFLTTIRGMSMTNFCEHMSEAPEHIKIFGGGALAENINENTAYVFSNAGSCSDHSIALLFMGGDDFYVSTSFIAGWKPLGRELHVTKAHSSELIELDNKPAYDTYYRYLRIKNDDHFFKNTLEFPFLYRCHGIDILRAPVSSMSDGTLIMTSDIEEGSKARIAYGDPWTILDSIKHEAHKYTEFKPEVIAVFSCAARRTFWGDNEVTKELTPFQQIASTYGFYTSSEFQRTDKYLIQHNVTLAIAAMREGEVIAYEKPVIKTDDDIQGGASMISRLANFIQASTEELEDAIEQLGRMAISDGMTGLLNRKEIQRRITNAVHTGEDGPVSLIMMDIDNFKRVNDTCGHSEGDNVLIALADMMKRNIAEYAPHYDAGRWGGEEFMILCPHTSISEASDVAELIRKDFSELVFEKAGSCTISLGVAEAKPCEDPDSVCKRVDDALYAAKSSGKNRVIIS